jgi:hypothetical protein
MPQISLPQNYEKLTQDQRRRVREAYIAKQNGRCAHCKEPLSGKPSIDVVNKSINEKLFPESFFDYPVHLHHCHKTGMTIGAVHNRCNAFLWQYFGE